jgi:hypothetical protein
MNDPCQSSPQVAGIYQKKLMKLTQWICELLEKKQKRLDNKANEELMWQYRHPQVPCSQ